MTSLYFTADALSGRDLALWRWSTAGMIAGGLLSWASLRLATSGRSVWRWRHSSSQTPADRTRQERWFNLVGLVMTLIVAAWLGWRQASGTPSMRPWLAVGWATGFFLLLHLRILWHEGGHLAAASLVGMQPLGVHIGSGPVVRRGFTANGFYWDWRLLPMGGFTHAVDRRADPAAWRFFVFVAGGPLVGGMFEALVFVALYLGGALGLLLPGELAVQGENALTWLLPFAYLPLWALVFPAVAGLIPHAGTHDGRVYYSDGWWLCRAFFLPATLFRERAYAAACGHLRRLRESGRHEQARAEQEFAQTLFPKRRTALTLLESHWHQERGELAAAEASFQRGMQEGAALEAILRAATFAQHAAMLAAGGHADAARTCCEAVLARVPESDRAPYLNAFARVPIYHRTAAALLPDAERWCAATLERLPDKITLHGTWGAILFERERSEEALPILQEVLASTQSANDRGIAAFYLALDALRRGQRRAARQLRADALRWCKVPAMIRRVHAELPRR